MGRDGTTNYIHMMGAGHLRYNLTKWHNLHRFQNQGWEAYYNQQVAAFWHHQTEKGEGCDKSKIRPIAHWIL